MKRILSLLCIVALLSTFGCGTKISKEKELIMWLAGSETQAMSVNEVAKEFLAETGIKVRCEAVSWGEAHSKYLTSIAGGVTPDIGTMGLTWGTEFGTLGAMIDLGEVFPEDVSAIKENVFPGIWESVDYRGKVYGIPFDMTEHIMYYRNDMIPHPPETWFALTETLKELKKEEKSMIFDWGSLNWIGYSAYLWQAGGNYYNKDFSECTLDTEEAARGMEFFANLYNKLGVPKTQIPLEQGMRTGDFPLAISGNWKIVDLTIGAPELKGKWSIAPLPKGPSGKRTAFIGGRIMGIFAQSENKNEAWQFIKFLFQPKNQITLYKKAWQAQDTYLPPNMNTWEVLPMEDGFKEVLKTQALDTKGPPPVVVWDASTRFVDQAIQKVVLTNTDTKTALKEATRLMNAELKKGR
ncbi:MAG: extracellular solute-binding protein [Candidatus Omnitrophica bacterium]|nr:extracellular solute-binding protein [Candidatus Omnitrophota bacterium]